MHPSRSLILALLAGLSLYSCNREEPPGTSSQSTAANANKPAADTVYKGAIARRPGERLPSFSVEQALPENSTQPQTFPDPLAETDTLIERSFRDSLVLIDGDLWLFNPQTQLDRQLTRTDSNIEEFHLSPTRKYVVCSRIIKYIEDAGIFDEGEQVPQRAVSELLVINLLNNRVIRQVGAPQDIFISFDRWISKSRFVCHSAGFFDVSAFYVFDAFRDSLQEVDYRYYEEER